MGVFAVGADIGDVSSVRAQTPSRCSVVVCVTESIAVGSQRDEQDATGHNQVIEGYLA
jgi:hypothetical protein